MRNAITKELVETSVPDRLLGVSILFVIAD
jgi:hypothetical protein